MRILQILTLLSILSFSSVTFAKTSKDLKVSKTQSSVNANFPNPFRPIIDIFKKILWIKPKPTVDCVNIVANVEDLILSETEISINQTKNIRVHIIAKEPKDSFLIYSYSVSGGKILAVEGTGESKFSTPLPDSYTIYTTKNHSDGAKVIWDLSGVKPGTYTITAAVDDGCGFCGMTKTKTVIVKE